MEKTEVERNQIINQLIRIGHGDLKIYNEIGLKAVELEPELFAHLIAWNEKKGEVRDSKVALPVIALRGGNDQELLENAAAHLCKLSPRDLLRACRYHRELPTTFGGGAWWLKHSVFRFLREREKNTKWWDQTAVQHRTSLKSLYAMYHVKPSKRAQQVLFDKIYPANSVFEKIAQLKDMKPDEAAGTILNHKIPFLIAVGALGGIKGKTDVIMAIIDGMSGNELITNTNMLDKMGVFQNPVLKTSYDTAIARMKKDKKVSSLKAGQAAKYAKSKQAIEKLDQIQEQNLQKLGGIEGDWLVLGDRSGSMHQAIEVAKMVSALIAQQVKGKVYLVFFNSQPNFLDVTGKTLMQIQEMARRIVATGGTSIGCGLHLLMEKNIPVNGIAICSDGGDNRDPYFYHAYDRYVAKVGVEPNVYFYRVSGDYDSLSSSCRSLAIQLETFDIGSDVDYYSLGNLVRTMKINKYSLIEEIMEVPLLTMDAVFGRKEAA